MATVQPQLWDASAPRTDDLLVEHWFATHRSIAGKGHRKAHHTRRIVAHTALDVCERTAATLAMDASKDCLLALIVIVGLQALASAAVMMAASVLLLAGIHTALRRFE